MDEYRLGDVSAPKELIRQLESLGARLLVTSRNDIPFTLGTYGALPIAASLRDVRAFVTARVGSFTDVVRQRDGLSEEITERMVEQAHGMFLTPKLQLELMSSCRTIADVKALLKRSPPTLEDVYRELFADIRAKTSWVMRLFYLLIMFKERSMEARAMLEYLACDDWVEGQLSDYIRTANVVLATCRGLVNLEDQFNENEWMLPSLMPNFGKGFQFSLTHRSTRMSHCPPFHGQQLSSKCEDAS